MCDNDLNSTPKKKCDKFDDDILAINFAGFEIDPCIYDEIEVIPHCTVHILKCQKCGHIEIEWERETEDFEDDSDMEEEE